MKYSRTFVSQNIEYKIESLDDYTFQNRDLSELEDLLLEPKIYNYVTDYVIKEYGIANAKEVARDFLESASKRWADKPRFVDPLVKIDDGFIRVSKIVPSIGYFFEEFNERYKNIGVKRRSI